MNFADIGAITWEWVDRTFGHSIATNAPERTLRLLEEAIELYQASGGSKTIALAQVEETFARPKGAINKELAQVGMVWSACCHQFHYDPHYTVRDEMMRVLNLEPGKPRDRMYEKFSKGLSHVEILDMKWLSTV